MPEADEGDSLRPLTPLTKRLLWLPALMPPPLAVAEAAAVAEVAVEGVVEEVPLQRSASPGVRSTTSNDTKGKGKGKGRKMGCMYFNQGKGSCSKG